MGDFSNTALTGLDAASFELSQDSNNIANVNTLGYKAEGSHFYDLYSGESTSGVGAGVSTGDPVSDFSQGSTIQTGRVTDMLIDGEGFFNVKDTGTGQMFYTRAGSFNLDQTGFLITQQGFRVQGYPAPATSGALSDLQINKEPSPPSATKNLTFSGNLKNAASDPVTQTITYYDKKGSSHTLGVTFTYNSTNQNWDLTYSVDGTAVSQTPAQTMAFDDTGKLTSGGNQTIDLDGSGSGTDTIDIDFSAMTSFGDGGNVSGPTASADGFPAGNYSGFTVEPGGVLVARFTNGQTKDIGSIAISTFSSNDGLESAGQSNWRASRAAGSITTGVSGAGTVGEIVSGKLEGSNVNLSNQVVDMISAQRNFQSNAQVLKTGKILDQAILQINN